MRYAAGKHVGDAFVTSRKSSTVFGSPRNFYDTLRGEIEELTKFPHVLDLEYSNSLKKFKGNQNACC